MDISNKARLGISEREIAQLVYNGARELMKMEITYTS
ncbi:hypothetical protein KBC03_01165 [Patescibacteria group bacterium]|nr:hypothetical protein [Patescibacteria group bacterium]